MEKIRWKRIKDFQNYKISSIGKVKNVKTKRILLPSMCRGFPFVNLNGIHHRIHILVAHAFLPSPPDSRRLIVRHINGDPSDNRASNLYWGSGFEYRRYFITKVFKDGMKEKIVRGQKLNIEKLLERFDSSFIEGRSPSQKAVRPIEIVKAKEVEDNLRVQRLNTLEKQLPSSINVIVLS
jgi:hypothetical protein